MPARITITLRRSTQRLLATACVLTPLALLGACGEEQADQAPGPDAGAGSSGDGPGQIADVSCNITKTLTMSPVIPTVASVEFSSDLASIDSARIELGLDQSYGMTAPVDLAEPGYRTLLLGMKASREYHYRIVLRSGDQRCASEDATLQTGPLPNQPQLFDVTVDTPQPDKVARGFILGGIFMQGPAFILDSDGDYVWWYDAGDTARARMSYDGKFMWMRNVNVRGGGSEVRRVSMDGTQEELFDIDSELGDGHHDFTVLPDESVVYIEHAPDSGFASGCDRIMERSPDGTTREIANASDVHGGTDCHVNSVHYHADDDSITFSDLDQNCYAKITREGEVVWVMGGTASQFDSGDGATWDRQHGHHMLALDRMMMFENDRPGQNSKAYEVVFDLTAGSVERVWRYEGEDLSTFVLGDVQRLPNGNTLVTYTTAGTMHEVDADEQLVRSYELSIGGAVGYTQFRESLYGPPPR